VSTERPSLVGLDRAELEAIIAEIGQPRYRAGQIARRLYRQAAQTWDAFSELPLAARTALAERFDVSPLVVARRMRSADDVDKLLVHRGDEQVYECVLLPYADRVSCCLSTQVGCPMGCTFCATGLGGFDRNLSTAEIVGQLLLLQSISPRRISHVVFMGMGEPLLNLDHLISAMGIMHDEIGLSYRRMTVSTVGLVPQIRRLAGLGLPIHLALSLHSPLDEIRTRLMPVNQRWPVAEVVGSMREYALSTGRKVTFEYLLIDRLNDSAEQARALAKLVKGIPCVVNLIPFNWVDTGNGYARPERSRVRAFRKILVEQGVNVTERLERGHDIAAACGQLAGQHQGRFARRREMAPLPVA
jgi:23S rRNA (adenine2503-C2)-methyltransferase